MMEAYLYESLDTGKVQCNLCSHRCEIKNGRRGICNVRENRGGTLETLVYGRLIAQHIDPIEKKPLFHLYPGSQSYSVATVGCNFKCRFCQNADIAQMPGDRDGIITGKTVSPETIVELAKKGNCKSIAYTYTEPTVYFEFAFDTARLAHKKNILNVFVTNGFMTPEAIQMISPYLDGANVDLKSFSNDFYKKYCGARIEPVKKTLELLKSLNVLLEITTLLIPGLNDSRNELENLAQYIHDALGPEIPWHISRFHPTYKLTDRPPTPVDTLIMAREIGLKAGLRYVYTGNVPGEQGENTFCYNCGNILISRFGFHVQKIMIENSKCIHCDAEIDVVGL